MSRIVIGPGGTGRTHTLARWAHEEEQSGHAVRRLTAGPAQAVSAAQVSSLLAEGPDVVVVDDAQWCEPEAVEALLTAAGAGQVTILASRRPTAPDDRTPATLLDALDDALSNERPAQRVGLIAIDDFAPALAGIRDLVEGPGGGALAADEVAAVHDLSGGSVGLAADLVAAGWDRRGTPPAEVVDAVARRVRRAGSLAAELVAAWSVADVVPTEHGTTLELALAVLKADGTEAERAVRAGGLVGTDGRLIPLVVRATLVELGGPARAELHDRLGLALAAADPTTAARHLRRGTGADPTTPGLLAAAAQALPPADHAEADALLARAEEWGLPPAEAALARGLAAFGRGAPEALAHLDRAEQLGAGSHDDADGTGPALLGFGLDLRELRFAEAAARPLTGSHGPILAALATALTGPAPETGSAEGPLGAALASTVEGIRATAEGRTPEAMTAFVAAADDLDRLSPALPLGFTPHQIGALAALTVGDATTVATVTDQALAAETGGRGETLAHQLLGAYGALVEGDYQPALDVLRAHTATPDRDGDPVDETGAPLPPAEGDDDGAGVGAGADDVHCQRDRLLLSAVEAAVARRSGDTGRLRAAWARAERALLRQSASWLLADPLGEILACGARLGDHHRIEPVVEAITAQTDTLPGDGPGPVVGWWLRLQVALAADDNPGVADAAAAMAALNPVDRRSKARVAAAAVWAEVVERRADEATVVAAADDLVACGDGWEASRLLGQAALDESDPQAARRLLERARTLGVEAVDDGGADGLAALGLSDRETEVAVLVVEGRTHKEIGAQLYISPKTVEHHVARIRQKLGAGSRAELLSIVRDALG